MSPDRVENLVRRVVGQVLAERGRARSPAGHVARASTPGVHVDVELGDPRLRPEARSEPKKSARGGGRGPELVTTDCLARIERGGTFVVPSGGRVTPLAREEAFRRGIRLVEGSGVASASGHVGRVRVAVGADHGGFALKQAVVEWLAAAGHEVLDMGTHDERAVDYPDFARAVAEAVADGRAELGICVDGAGIGSAMAANKVPGVRAANAWNRASAVNAREHNYANVLTLGGKMLATAAAHEIVTAFLTTPWGEARHGKRVAKIDAIERRYGRAGAVGEGASS